MATIKEHGILFSSAMVRAILAGQKTQTRRAVRGATGAFWDHAAWRPVLSPDGQRRGLVRRVAVGVGLRLPEGGVTALVHRIETPSARDVWAAAQRVAWRDVRDGRDRSGREVGKDAKRRTMP